MQPREELLSGLRVRVEQGGGETDAFEDHRFCGSRKVIWASSAGSRVISPEESDDLDPYSSVRPSPNKKTQLLPSGLSNDGKPVGFLSYDICSFCFEKQGAPPGRGVEFKGRYSVE